MTIFRAFTTLLLFKNYVKMVIFGHNLGTQLLLIPHSNFA